MGVIKANYGVCESMLNGLYYIYTKLFWPKARFIRLPFRMRGKSGLKYGSGFTVGYSCRLEVGGRIEHPKLIIGENCVIGDYAHIAANYSVRIGNNVLMASRVFISDTSHGNYGIHGQGSSPNSSPNSRVLSFLGVVIGDNVWIGENVSILQGVSIGNGSIIGANSVVTKDIPENCIAAGVPARVLKRFNQETNIWEPVPGSEI